MPRMTSHRSSWPVILSSELGLLIVVDNGAFAGWALLRIDWKAQACSSACVGGVFVAGVDEVDVQTREACAAVWTGQNYLVAAYFDRWEQIPIHQSARQVSVYPTRDIASPSHDLPFPALGVEERMTGSRDFRCGAIRSDQST